MLFWYVLTRFQSGQINAIDFTIYYDRPCYQTVQGRPLFVEVSDTIGFSDRSELERLRAELDSLRTLAAAA